MFFRSSFLQIGRFKQCVFRPNVLLSTKACTNKPKNGGGTQLIAFCLPNKVDWFFQTSFPDISSLFYHLFWKVEQTGFGFWFPVVFVLKNNVGKNKPNVSNTV